MEENQKDILINVKVDNQDAFQSTDALKNKFKQLQEQALSFDNIDYNNASISDLRDHLNQANTVLKDLKKSGLATDQQLADMGKTVSKLKDNIAGMKIGNVFKGAEASIMGVVGTAQLLEGGMKALGIESESVEQGIERMVALMSLKDGVEGLGKYAEGMKGIMGATAGASSATTIFRLALSSLGIGLIISAVVYLTNNWESLSKTIKEFLPEFDSVTKYFKNIMPIMEGVGKGVIGFIVRPIKSAIEAFQLLKKGDWKGAGKTILEALNPISALKNIVKDFKSGYATGIVNANKKKNEEIKKDNAKAIKTEIDDHKKLEDERKKLIDEVNKYIIDANKLIADSKKTARQKELNDIDVFYASQIQKAKNLNVDTSQLLEAKRLKDLEINKKYDNEEIKQAKEAKEKALQEGVATAQTQGQIDTLNAETGADTSTSVGLGKVSEVKLNALKTEYEAEQLLYADNLQKLELLDAEYANKVWAINKELTDKKKEESEKQLADEKAKNEANLNGAVFVADAITAIAGEASAIGKASAVASATMNTYQSATKALAEVPYPMSYAVVASNIAMGLMNVKKILATKTVGNTSSGSNVQAPIINTTQLAPKETQDVRVVSNTIEQKQEPVRAYIVNKDLTNQQEKDNFNNSLSTY